MRSCLNSNSGCPNKVEKGTVYCLDCVAQRNTTLQQNQQTSLGQLLSKIDKLQKENVQLEQEKKTLLEQLNQIKKADPNIELENQLIEQKKLYLILNNKYEEIRLKYDNCCSEQNEEKVNQDLLIYLKSENDRLVELMHKNRETIEQLIKERSKYEMSHMQILLDNKRLKSDLEVVSSKNEHLQEEITLLKKENLLLQQKN